MDDNKWLDSSSGETFTDDGATRFFFQYWGGKDAIPVFEDISSEDVAEAKIASGDIKVEDAPDVNAASAIADYQNYEYYPLNMALRNGEQLRGHEAVVDAGLQQAFGAQEPTKYSMNLYRDSGTAITAKAFEDTGLDDYLEKNLHTGSLLEAWNDMEIRSEIRSKLIGYEFVEKGYTSTSSSVEAFEKFSASNSSGDLITSTGAKENMFINVPQGTKVLDLGKDGYIPGSGEYEVILNKGAKYKIYHVDYNHETEALMLYCRYSEATN